MKNCFSATCDPASGDWQAHSGPTDYLVRLGQLSFRDFLLLDAEAIGQVLRNLAPGPDLAVALSNAPDVERHMIGMGRGGQMEHTPGRDAVAAAQERLVRRFALLLLKYKSPPLYDSLPWHDWDLSVLTRRFSLWKTRLLLTGEGAVTLIARLRRTAGIYLVESCAPLARYAERRAELDRIRRLTVSRAFHPPDSPVDLVIICSLFAFTTCGLSLLDELCGSAANALIVENCPVFPLLEPSRLAGLGFRSATVSVHSLGPRPCWFKGPQFA